MPTPSSRALHSLGPRTLNVRWPSKGQLKLLSFFPKIVATWNDMMSDEERSKSKFYLKPDELQFQENSEFTVLN